jgi:hypothetical protein
MSSCLLESAILKVILKNKIMEMRHLPLCSAVMDFSL